MRLKHFLEHTIAPTILLFLCTPTFSITSAFFGFFLPNDKLAFAIILVLFFTRAISLEKSKSNTNLIFLTFITALSTTLVFTFRFLILSIEPSVADINHLVSIFQTIAFAFYFSTITFSNFFKALSFATLINVISASVQTWLLFQGFSNLTLIFSNYPLKVTSEYIPKMGAVIALPRVYGLFHESSSLSILCALVLLILISPYLYTKQPLYIAKISRFISSNPRFCIFIAITSFVGLILSYSLSGLLALILPVVYFSLSSLINNPRMKLKLYLLLIPATTIIILIIYFGQTVNFLLWTLTQSDRNKSTIEVIERFASSDFLVFLVGSPLLATRDLSWDVWSRFFDAFGLIGSPLNYVWYLFILFSRFSPFTLFGLCQSLTGGSLSASQSLITLSIIWYIHSTLENGIQANKNLASQSTN